MGKLDDRYGGKRWPPGSKWLPLCRRYLCGGACLVVATALLVFFWRWSELWCRKSEATGGGGSRSGGGVDSFVLLRERERASYDRLMRFLLHPRAPCLTQEVFGGRRGTNKRLDGDKVVCLEPGPGIGEDCIVYSFGVSDDWSFEESIRAKFGCQVFSFDPSVGEEDHEHSQGIRFYNTGIGEFDGRIRVGGEWWQMRTLDSLLRDLGHTNRTIDVLKMDIEGAEYVVLEDMLAKGLLNRVNHLCVELHLPDNPYWTRVHRLLKRVEEEAGLRHFSTRNNTQMPPMRVPGFYSRLEQHFFEMAWYRH